MDIHENARLTPRGRELLIRRPHRGEHPADVATSMGVSPRTVYPCAGATGRRAFPKAVENQGAGKGALRGPKASSRRPAG
ncbi:MAG: hypothetical protein IIC57_10325 [Proteobacteria bacterium]|nr:hypothetical protein [Pseudomonadota bacterium]